MLITLPVSAPSDALFGRFEARRCERRFRVIRSLISEFDAMHANLLGGSSLPVHQSITVDSTSLRLANFTMMLRVSTPHV